MRGRVRCSYWATSGDYSCGGRRDRRVIDGPRWMNCCRRSLDGAAARRILLENEFAANVGGQRRPEQRGWSVGTGRRVLLQ